MCLGGGTRTAGGSPHLLGSPQPCPVLVATEQAAPRARVLPGCSIPGEALACGICPDAAAMKRVLDSQFRRAGAYVSPARRQEDVSEEQRPWPPMHGGTVVPMLPVSGAGDMHHWSPRQEASWTVSCSR